VRFYRAESRTDSGELKIYPYFWCLFWLGLKRLHQARYRRPKGLVLCRDVGSSTQALSYRNWKAYESLSMSSTSRHESWQLQFENVTTTFASCCKFQAQCILELCEIFPSSTVHAYGKLKDNNKFGKGTFKKRTERENYFDGRCIEPLAMQCLLIIRFLEICATPIQETQP